MTISLRLLALTAAAVFGLVLVAGVNLYQINKVYQLANYANDNVVPTILALGRAVQSAHLQLYQPLSGEPVAKHLEPTAVLRSPSHAENPRPVSSPSGCAGPSSHRPSSVLSWGCVCKPAPTEVR